MLDIYSFDGAHVSASGVRNSAKDVDVFIVKFATCMVVPSLVQLWEHAPLVLLAVVDFTLSCWSINFLTSASDNNVVVRKTACGMTMARNGHISFCQAIELLSLLIEGKKACFEHWSWRKIVVTSSNDVNPWIRANLDYLEVVRKTNLEIPFCLAVVYLTLGNLSIESTVHQYLFRVLVKYVDVLRHGRVQMWNLGCFRDIRKNLLFYAVLWHLMVLADLRTLFHMIEYLTVLEYLLATWACEKHHLHDFLHISVQLLRLCFASAAVYGTLPS